MRGESGRNKIEKRLEETHKVKQRISFIKHKNPPIPAVFLLIFYNPPDARPSQEKSRAAPHDLEQVPA
jgi:hypothetical protein